MTYFLTQLLKVLVFIDSKYEVSIYIKENRNLVISIFNPSCFLIKRVRIDIKKRTYHGKK